MNIATPLDRHQWSSSNTRLDVIDASNYAIGGHNTAYEDHSDRIQHRICISPSSRNRRNDHLPFDRRLSYDQSNQSLDLPPKPPRRSPPTVEEEQFFSSMTNLTISTDGNEPFFHSMSNLTINTDDNEQFFSSMTNLTISTDENDDVIIPVPKKQSPRQTLSRKTTKPITIRDCLIGLEISFVADNERLDYAI
jgi:hypothetical protein